MNILDDGYFGLTRVFPKVAKGSPILRKVEEMVRLMTIQATNCIRMVGSQ